MLSDLRAAGAAVLVVTHDPEEAMQMADDLLLMSDGRILQSGSPEACYLRPVSLVAARLLGEALVLPARIAGGIAQTPLGPIPAPGVTEGAGTVMARPEALHLDEPGASAQVIDVRFCGAFHLVTLDAAGTRITVRASRSPPAVGALTGVVLDARRAVVYAGSEVP
jgi:iron(III) transport system ATP-binding protein